MNDDAPTPITTFSTPENAGDQAGLFTLRDQLKSELQNTNGLTQAAAATQMGVSPAVVSQYLNGRYTGDVPGFEKKVRAWLDGRRRKLEAARKVPTGIPWFEAPTSKAIYQALQYAQTMADLVVICGGAGLGKTVTCEHYQKEHTAVWYARMSPSSASAPTCLVEIAEALGIKPRRGESARQNLKSIIRKVTGTEGLLIIDEAQELEKAALEEVRAILDEARIGIALVGNETVYTQLTGGSRAAHYAQLFSRIGFRLLLAKPKKTDVGTLARSWGIEDPEAIELLERISQMPGALRLVTKNIRLAFIDETAPATPDRAALERAWAYVGSER